MAGKPNDLPFEHGDIEVSELKELVGKSDPIIIEVGANVGQTTEKFLREMPGATIYCFEPEPRAIAKFKARILRRSLNPFRKRIHSENVTLIERAVGNKNGVVRFVQSGGGTLFQNWNQSGSIRQPKKHLEQWPKVKFTTEIEVPIVRLDDWAAENNIDEVDLIWADTQGAESDLIEGGRNILRNTRIFYTEYGAMEWYEGQISLDQLCSMLSKTGHGLVRKFEGDALFINQGMMAAGRQQ